MRGSRRKSVRTLELILSSACNLACTYCYQNDKKRGRMSWETARTAIDFALDEDAFELDIVFIGGEPMLEFETIRRAVAHVSDRRGAKEVRYHIVTNGLLIGDEHVDFFVTNDFRVRLSFDGVPAAQRLRGPGTFERLDRLVEGLRMSRPSFLRDNVTVTITVLPATVSVLPDSLRYFLDAGIRQIDLSPQSTDTTGWDPRRISELEAAFRQLFEISLAHYNRTGDVPLRDLRRRAGTVESRPATRSLCGVGSGENLAVDSDGEAYGCVTFARSYQKLTPFLEARLDPMRLGKAEPTGLGRRLEGYPAAADRAELFRRHELKYSSYGRCAECRYLTSCSICPVSIGRQAGNEDPHRIPDFLCAYNLVSNAFRERFPASQFEIFSEEEEVPGFLQDLRREAERIRIARGVVT